MEDVSERFVTGFAGFANFSILLHRLSTSTSHRPSSVPTAYLCMRVSEPCTCCALKQAHMCIVFHEEVIGTQKTERISHTQLYEIIYAELLTSALPGHILKQAPRLFVSILVALEKFVMQSENPAYLRVFALWMNVQCWCTLRFSDHRGIKPSMVRVEVRCQPYSHGRRL